MRRLATLLLVGLGLAALVLLDPPTRAGHAAAPDLAITAVDVAPAHRSLVPQDGGPAVELDRRLTIHGRGFLGTAFGPDVDLRAANGASVTSPLVLLLDSHTVEAWVPAGVTGPATLVLTNADHRRLTRAVDL